MKYRVLLLVITGLWLSGCSSFFGNHAGKNTVSSSLVQYLYPDEESRKAISESIPHLQLPVKVGIAFIPPTGGSYGSVLDSKTQMDLLEKVRSSFKEYEYIDRIEIIPATYLAQGKGFDTLDQLARLYDVDIMALVSYDQVARSYENNAALLYWTIVGMYVIPGNDNSVQTFVDTAVFDVASRKMLFRAPGLSKTERSSTAVGAEKNMHRQSLQGFELAVDDMVVNLNSELDRFKTRVKEEKVASVEYRNRSYGGGALGGVVCTGLLLLAFARRRSLRS